MTPTTRSNHDNLDEFNQSLQEILISNGVLYSQRNKRCGRTRWVGLERSPSDKFRRTFDCEDMSCPVCRSKRVNRGIYEVKEYTKGFTEYGGRQLLVTLTLNHTRKHTYKYLRDGIRKSLTNFHNSHGWRKLRKDLDIQFYYDRFETTHSPKHGFHVHCHSVLGVMNHEMTKDEIKSRVLREWNKSLKSEGLRTVSPKYGVNIRDGVGFETYGLKQEQNDKSLKRLCEKMKQKLHKKFEPMEIQTVQESKEKFLKGRDQIDYTDKGYSIGELEGELTMFTMFPDYQNPNYTKDQIIKILKDVKRRGDDVDEHHLRIHKTQMGEPIWIDSEKPKKKKVRKKELKKTRRRRS